MHKTCRLPNVARLNVGLRSIATHIRCSIHPIHRALLPSCTVDRAHSKEAANLRIDRDLRLEEPRPPLRPLSYPGLDPIKLAFILPVGLYVSSPGNRADCYAEPAVSSPFISCY